MKNIGILFEENIIFVFAGLLKPFPMFFRDPVPKFRLTPVIIINGI
jgi:hypothetical protein